jgi:hypothetical protein
MREAIGTAAKGFMVIFISVLLSHSMVYQFALAGIASLAWAAMYSWTSSLPAKHHNGGCMWWEEPR